MRIAIFDDLHLEGGGYGGTFVGNDKSLPNEGFPTADVCVLAGDICKAALLSVHRTDADARAHRKNMTAFFTQVSEKYNTVLYVMGNHEHYAGVFENSAIILRVFLKQWPNIILLDNETIEVMGVTFFGATMWTDCNKSNAITCQALRGYMNDFFGSIMHAEGGKFSPEFSAMEHEKTLKALNDAVVNCTTEKMVVITHHCPSHESLDERFADQIEGNYGYFSDLDLFIMDNPKIKVWFHGHVHSAKDYYIGDTRVVCNPRGYAGEIRWGTTGYNPRKIVEV